MARITAVEGAPHGAQIGTGCRSMSRFAGIGLAPLVAAALGVGCLATDPGPDIDGTPGDTIVYQTVESGAAHACGLSRDGAALCWGDNAVGQLGLGDVDSRYEPWPVLQGSLSFTQVSGGGTHTCALTEDRDVYCWGGNGFGQLGTDAAPAVEPNPVRVFTDVKFLSVEVGGAHTCGVTSLGIAYCWGLPGDGQIGTGLTGNQPWPTPDSVRGGHEFRELSAGDSHTCGATPGGKAYCWGAGAFGELGHGQTSSSPTPVEVSGDHLFFKISAGYEHTCALNIDGDAFCWGAGGDGRLGNGGVSSSNVPVAVVGGIQFSSISAGGAHTCGITGTGAAYCWGRNDGGQLGDGTLVSRLVPTPVVGGLEFEVVSAGTGPVVTVTCGLATDGLLYCWGDGLGGQLGNGESERASVPTPVLGQLGLN